MLIKIKPLSVNQSWKGKRYRTDKYRYYAQELLLKLRPSDIPKGKIKLLFVVGYSSPLADIDNFLKPAIDVMQKKYGFNDNRVKKLDVESTVVPKGSEFIYIEILSYTPSPLLVALLNKIKKDV